jgi:integrase
MSAKTGRGSKTVHPIRDLDKVKAIQAMLRDKPRDYLLFTLGINLALRVSDLLSLRVSDVRDKDGIREYLTVSERKTNKVKRIKITGAAREHLQWFFDQTGQESGYLFKSRKGKDRAIDKTQAWRLITGWCKAVGIKENCGTHTLRKTWGYHARKKGIALELIQAKFGHSHPAITTSYIGITTDEIEEVEELVSF